MNGRFDQMRLTGEWRLARRTFGGLGFRMNKVTKRSAREEAEMVVKRIKRNLRAQVYAKEGRHPSLSPETVKNKKNSSNADKILLDTEEFINSIQVITTGPRTHLVGVQGSQDVIDRAMANEFGAPEKNIPARSTFRVEIARIKADGKLSNMESAFKKVLKGKR